MAKRTKAWLALGLLLLVVGVSRLLIITWALPYPGNPAHEHSMFYDSRLVVNDQYHALRGLYQFPRGLISESIGASWPLLQRYLAAPPLLIWFGISYGFNVESVMAAPFEKTAYQTLLVNRIISWGASLLTLVFAWKLFATQFSKTLAFFLTSVLALTASEIGLAIHERSASILTTFYVLEAYLLYRWTRHKEKIWPHLAVAAFVVGLATAAREYALLFGGLLFAVVVLRHVGGKWRDYLSGRTLVVLVLSVLAGISVGSPEMFAELWYWAQFVVDPGGAEWQTNSFATIPQDMWSATILLFGGSFGAAFFWLASAAALVRFRRLSPFAQAITIWVWLYVIIMSFYPLKTPRFFAGVAPFGLLLIGYFIVHVWFARSKYVVGLLLSAWFIQAILWGISTLKFFSGTDNRILAADDFHATVPEGTSVATFFRWRHSRQIPVDDWRYQHYAAVPEHSVPGAPQFISRGQELGSVGIWPEYVLIQYETGAHSYPPDQPAIQMLRDSVLSSGRYILTATYPKRSWELGSYGLFGTTSRWAYLNPVVEVYKRVAED